jgi:hypothetical protein
MNQLKVTSNKKNGIVCLNSCDAVLKDVWRIFSIGQNDVRTARCCNQTWKGRPCSNLKCGFFVSLELCDLLFLTENKRKIYE